MAASGLINIAQLMSEAEEHFFAERYSKTRAIYSKIFLSPDPSPKKDLYHAAINSILKIASLIKNEKGKSYLTHLLKTAAQVVSDELILPSPKTQPLIISQELLGLINTRDALFSHLIIYDPRQEKSFKASKLLTQAVKTLFTEGARGIESARAKMQEASRIDPTFFYYSMSSRSIVVLPAALEESKGPPSPAVPPIHPDSSPKNLVGTTPNPDETAIIEKRHKEASQKKQREIAENKRIAAGRIERQARITRERAELERVLAEQQSMKDRRMANNIKKKLERLAKKTQAPIVSSASFPPVVAAAAIPHAVESKPAATPLAENETHAELAAMNLMLAERLTKNSPELIFQRWDNLGWLNHFFPTMAIHLKADNTHLIKKLKALSKVVFTTPTTYLYQCYLCMVLSVALKDTPEETDITKLIPKIKEIIISNQLIDAFFKATAAHELMGDFNLALRRWQPIPTSPLFFYQPAVPGMALPPAGSSHRFAPTG